MLTEKQLEVRKSGIGGSDVAPILGLSPWRTAYEVWAEKVGLTNGNKADNPAMAYGRMMEPVIRQFYADATGRAVTVPQESIRHPEHPFVLGLLDGIAGDRVLEIKTARSGQDWGEPGTDQIPVYYQTQVQLYMLITRLPVTDVVVSIAGSMPEIYEVSADTELQGMILQAVIDFWKLVETRTPPDPVSYSDVVAMFGKKASGTAIAASESILSAVSDLRTVREQLKALEAREEALRAEVFKYMGENDTLLGPDEKCLATWKLAKPSSRFNSKLFQADEPELYKQYCVEGEPSRRFLLK